MIDGVRVLLVNSNRSRILEPPPPAGLGYVATAAMRAGHRVLFLDMLLSRDPERELRETIKGFNPEVVGVSVRNVDTIISQRVSWQLGEAADWVTRIRQLTRATVVVGGPAITALGAAALERIDADFAVIGEGEQTFPVLLQALETGGVIETIPGVCYRKNGRVLTNAVSRSEGFGASGVGDWVDWRRYEKAGATYPIHTKRGCSLSCLYCNYPEMEGHRVRKRNAVDVVDEIEEAQRRWHPSTFEFTDSAFNLPESHAAEICEEIVRRGLRVRLSSIGINPLGVSPQLLRLMQRAGFQTLHVSADAASDPVLAGLQKGFTKRDVLRCARLLRSSGIRCIWFFLFGAPGETKQTIAETLEFVETWLNSPRFLNVMLTGVRILPGTPLARQLMEAGRLDPACDLCKPLFYFSPEVSEQWVLERINRSIRNCPAIVHGGEQSGSLPERAFYRLLRAAGKAPPFIRYLPLFLRLPLLGRLRATSARTCPSSANVTL